jgi:hypothetical protein
VVGPAGTGDAGNFRHRRRLQLQQSEDEEAPRVAATAIVGPWKPEHPVSLPNMAVEQEEEGGDAGWDINESKERAAMIQSLAGEVRLIM